MYHSHVLTWPYACSKSIAPKITEGKKQGFAKNCYACPVESARSRGHARHGDFVRQTRKTARKLIFSAILIFPKESTLRVFDRCHQHGINVQFVSHPHRHQPRTQFHASYGTKFHTSLMSFNVLRKTKSTPASAWGSVPYLQMKAPYLQASPLSEPRAPSKRESDNTAIPRT